LGSGGFQGQAGCHPALDAVDDVAAVQAEPAEGGGGEDGLVALVADEDDTAVASGQVRIAVLARRVQAPLEDVAVDDGRSRDQAVALALL
jgi:hypothetical protein